MKTELDYGSGVPLYRQIKDILRAEISTGRSDAKNPITEAKLLERFSVSRAPIRQALKELVDDGFVYRKQGKGTFPVTGARVERPADLGTGNLYRYLAERGLNPTSQVSDIERVPATPAVRRHLGIESGERMLHFTRVIRTDGQALAIADIWIRSPDDFLPNEEELRDGGTSLALLEQRYGIVVGHSEHEAWATAATGEQARMLGVSEGSPLLAIDTVFYAKGGVAVGWRSAVHSAEEFKFRFVTS